MSPWNPFAIWFIKTPLDHLRARLSRVTFLMNHHAHKAEALADKAAVEAALAQAYQGRVNRILDLMAELESLPGFKEEVTTTPTT